MKTEINVYCQGVNCIDPATTKSLIMIGAETTYIEPTTGTQGRLYTCPSCNVSVTVTFRMLMN